MFPRLLIAAVIILQLVWFVIPSIGSHPVSPRVRQAIESHQSSPKSEQDAALAEAFAQDSADGSREAIEILALVGVVDIALIYFFWNYGTRKTRA
jgi:hypothetical protein